MNNVDIIFENLKANFLALINDIQVMKKINNNVYENICFKLNELCLALKGRDTLPRDILYEIYFASKILENEDPSCHENHEEIKRVANGIRYYFELILMGQSHEERKSGIPRII